MTLIQRCETAQTREEALSAFQSVYSDDFAPDYARHISQAIRSGSDTRAFGYLLLAAMAVVPEGWACAIGTTFQGKGWASIESEAFVMGPAEPDMTQAHFPCTALLAAILKANEAKDDQ